MGVWEMYISEWKQTVQMWNVRVWSISNQKKIVERKSLEEEVRSESTTIITITIIIEEEEEEDNIELLLLVLRTVSNSWNRQQHKEATRENEGPRQLYVFFKTFTLTHIFNTLDILPTYM